MTVHIQTPIHVTNDENEYPVFTNRSSSFLLMDSPLKKPYMYLENVSIKPSVSSSTIFGSFEVMVALFTYCFSSILMTLVNKFVLSELNFRMNFLLLAIQSFTVVLLLAFCKHFGILTYKTLNWSDTVAWFPVSTLLVAMIYSGSKGLQYLPVSLFTIFKNVTIIVIAYADKKYFNGKVTPLMMMSFFLIILSSLLAGISSLQFNLPGYIWMFLNCICTATYVLYMRKSIKKVDFADFDTVFYNNILSIPLLFILSIIIEDWSLFLNQYFFDSTVVSDRFYLLMGIVVSSVSAFLISYSTAWSIRVASSTTYSMVGALNKLPIALSGIIFIPSEKNTSFLNIFSILLAFASGILYSYSQYVLKYESDKAILTSSVVNQKV